MLLDLNESSEYLSQPVAYSSNDLTFEMKKKIEAFE
jgi:hypothetical protein